MTMYIHILGDSQVRLWGLSGKERLQRQIKSIAGALPMDESTAIDPAASVLYLRGDYLFDARLLQALVDAKEDCTLLAKAGFPAVAVRATAGLAGKVAQTFSQPQEAAELGLPAKTTNDFGNTHDLQLRKQDALTLLPISAENRQPLERELFSGSYKGVTDFVTKWIWPLPARLVTQLCVHKKIPPNHVTLLSLVLAILTGLAFYHGYLGTGLVLGWVMTFLDTVDGKLARVTVTSSRFGDLLDHGLDLIHPPLWYWAWALGLSAAGMLAPALSFVIWTIFVSYIGGRMCEGLFELWLTRFPIFIWRQLDSFNRLITARRNPNMVILSLAYLAARPDLGLYLVLIWHSVSSLFLAWRLVLAWRTKQREGALVSWLEQIDPQQDKHKLAVRVFTRRPLQI